MAQALVLFHCESPFSWQRSEIHADRRKGQTLVSPPAEPGAYLYELGSAHENIPFIFLNILSLTGYLPDQAVVFEDSDAGIAAAKNAGIQCIDVRGFGWEFHDTGRVQDGH
jgi:phosphoglycolate phosphatase-like HAD superfamily hydrolase